MTNEDKKIVADYMWWAQYKYPQYYLNTKGDIESHHFDLNDAGLVVQEMQKRGDLGSFIQYSWGLKTIYPERRNSLLEYIPYIFNADNFFKAFTEWRKGIKLDPVIDKESAAYMDN